MVLEARKNSETVWYNILWEEAKSASNVIDYNLNKEITKDTSAVSNANNDTTTGMANVIPWINSPKLVYSTSIVWYPVYPKTVLQLKWSWFPADTFSYFNNNTIISWGDVTLDPNHPEDIYLKKWLYLIFLNFDSHHIPTIEYTWRIYNIWDDGVPIEVFKYYGFNAEFTNSTIFEMKWWYLYSWVNPDSSLSWATFTATFLRIW